MSKTGTGYIYILKNPSFPDYIKIGYADDPNIVCTVVDERRIEYNGETMYITPFAKMVSGKEWLTRGPGFLVEHFEYNGVLLDEIVD